MHYRPTWLSKIHSKVYRFLHTILKIFLRSYRIDWKSYVQKTYILHLENRTDRKSNLTKELKWVKTKSGNLSQEVTWWNAFKGVKMWDSNIHVNEYSFYHHWFIDRIADYAHISPERMKNRMLKCSEAESNIVLGHHSILKDIVHNDIPVALILEDDVTFQYNIEKKLKDIFDNQLPDDWDMLYVSALPVPTGFQCEQHSKDLLKLYNGVWWFSGIFITKQGAQKLLDNLPIVGPIDLWINYQFKDLNVYLTNNNLIEQSGETKSDNTYSFIDKYGVKKN